jgi:hypothetical protein
MRSSNRNSPVGTKRAHVSLPRDKQLRTVNLSEVMEKCRLDQALSIKEFAVRAGISYSTAREWFKLSGFPATRGMVFYSDFQQWRNERHPERNLSDSNVRVNTGVEDCSSTAKALPFRASQILAEAGCFKPIPFSG